MEEKGREGRKGAGERRGEEKVCKQGRPKEREGEKIRERERGRQANTTLQETATIEQIHQLILNSVKISNADVIWKTCVYTNL